MANECTFDVVSKVDLEEVKNAVAQATKEIGQRFDFKGSVSKIDLKDEGALVLASDDEVKLKAVVEVLQGKLAKRGVSVRAMEFGKVEPAAKGSVRQEATIRQGIPQEKAKAMVKVIKDSKLKVQASIQGDAVRVSGAKRDLLQECIAMVRKEVTDFPLQYNNFRD